MNSEKSARGPYLELARQAERERPHVTAFDPWGRRVDHIRVSKAWEELGAVSAREGLVAIGYEREFQEHSRLYQFAKLFLFHPSSAFFTCPLAMTDGAAKVLENFAQGGYQQKILRHLIAREPKEFWTSGQWMTERTGGSDVSGTSTVARYEGERARLYGTKWFSSATTSPVALALARAPESPEGSRGLTLFLVETYKAPGELNGIQVLRLKDKLGTWALPTAELKLEGALATQVGALDQGVKTVATMLNITRLYNSVCSVGQATRALMQLRDYSAKRQVFGQRLESQPLHYTTFAREELNTLCGFLLTFELVHLLGKEECGTATSGQRDILRLMTPVCKLFCAKSAVQTASEVIEGFGGAGYIEDTGIPVHLRDAQVFAIWEGATNVLSLDLVRVVQKTEALSGDILDRVKALNTKSLSKHGEQLRLSVGDLIAKLKLWSQAEETVQVSSSRSLAFHLAKLYSFALLLSWVDQETPERQATLFSWLDFFAQNDLGQWRMTSAEDCLRGQKMWAGSLKN